MNVTNKETAKAAAFQIELEAVKAARLVGEASFRWGRRFHRSHAYDSSRSASNWTSLAVCYRAEERPGSRTSASTRATIMSSATVFESTLRG